MAPIDAAVNGFGVINVTGGTVKPGQFLVAGITNSGAIGIWNITGGLVQPGGNNGGTMGASSGTTGVVNLSGTGAYNTSGTTGLLVGEDHGGATGSTSTGVLNVSGSASMSMTGTGGLDLVVNQAALGIVNLGAVGAGGGTINTNIITQGSALGTGLFNFHGGTLKSPAAPNAAFFTGLTGAYVYGEGGIIDNNGQSITIGQAFLNPGLNGSSGVSSIGVSGGTGYAAAPYVSITGGGGTGATANATIDGNGNLTGIVITNPGTGYNSTPSVSLSGSNGTGALIGTITTVANTGGGLTFQGAGTTTLTGVSTYTGPTSISGAILKLSGTGSINNSSAINLTNAGKFVQLSSVASSPSINVAGGSGVDGTGTLGPVTTADFLGNVIANGNLASTTPLNINGALTFNGNATANIRLAYGSGGSIASAARITSTSLVTQATNSSGKVTINLNDSDSFWTPGTYDLFGFSSGPTGLTPAQVANLFTVGSFNLPLNAGRNQTATLTNPTGFIAIVITGDNPVWTGLVNGNWTTNAIPPDGSGNKNWKLQTAGTATEFLAGDSVLFDDTAGGTTNVVISSANVSTSAMVFNNSAKNYTISSPGGFGITGGSLLTNGTGSLTLNTANSYSGGTTLNAGLLNLGNASAIGTGSLVINGGTIDNTSGNPITLGISSQTWNSNVTFSGSSAAEHGQRCSHAYHHAYRNCERNRGTYCGRRDQRDRLRSYQDRHRYPRIERDKHV